MLFSCGCWDLPLFLLCLCSLDYDWYTYLATTSLQFPVFSGWIIHFLCIFWFYFICRCKLFHGNIFHVWRSNAYKWVKEHFFKNFSKDLSIYLSLHSQKLAATRTGKETKKVDIKDQENYWSIKISANWINVRSAKIPNMEGGMFSTLSFLVYSFDIKA